VIIKKSKSSKIRGYFQSLQNKGVMFKLLKIRVEHSPVAGGLGFTLLLKDSRLGITQGQVSFGGKLLNWGWLWGIFGVWGVDM
jgi:hypothetical protein